MYGSNADKRGRHDHALVGRINVDFNPRERFPEGWRFQFVGLLLACGDSACLGGAQHFDGSLSNDSVDLGGGFGGEGSTRGEDDAAASRQRRDPSL